MHLVTRGIVGAILVAVAGLALFAGCGGSTTTSGPEESATAAIAPPGLPSGPRALVNPTAPLLADGTLVPDARKAMLLLEFQVALEEFKAAKGQYPETLDAMFPAHAPLDEEGAPLSAAEAADFSYALLDPSHYELSVHMSDGEEFSLKEVAP